MNLRGAPSRKPRRFVCASACTVGTLLWTTTLPGHNLDFDGGWGIEPDPRRGGSQGPAWRIGRDGAICGVTLTGAFKLQ